MNPESLAVSGTNTQLEPIRRVIDSAVPTTRSGFVADAELSDRRPKTGLNSLCIAKFYRGHKTCELLLSVNSTILRLRPHSTAHSLAQGCTNPTTSLENPLLKLTATEYMTLRRYQEERALPQRFLGKTSAQSNASLAPKPHSTQTALAGSYNPKYQTTAQVR